jgi:hypothetical protein
MVVFFSPVASPAMCVHVQSLLVLEPVMTAPRFAILSVVCQMLEKCT